MALCALAAIAALIFTGPRAASALTPGQPLGLGFPRVCLWWPNTGAQPMQDIVRYDYIALQDSESARIPVLRALNPNIILLNSTSCSELSYDRTLPASAPINARMVAASARWALTQVGSTLSADVDAVTRTFPVASVSALGVPLFEVGELVVIGEEFVEVEAVGARSLTVTRGVLKPAASHSAGARVAATVSMWPEMIGYDLSTYCPRVTVDSSVGPETFAEWNARHGAALVADADWDGILLDRADGNQSWIVTGGLARSIDPDRSNTPVADYAVFDAEWNAGMRAYQDRLRSLIGNDRVILGNNSVTNFGALNGNSAESFPHDSTYHAAWDSMVFGPRGVPGGAYLDWVGQSRQPNLSALQSYERDGLALPDNPFGHPGWHPNYRKMRFGLTTALLGDGFFSYEMSSAGHGFLGLMWFDEYDNAGAGKGYLGQPTGPAHLATTALRTPDLLSGDGDLGTASRLARWSFSYDGAGYAATAEVEDSAARLDIKATGGLPQGVRLIHRAAVTAGTRYTLTFRARADRPRQVGFVLHEWADPWRTWATFESVSVDESWRTFEISCTASGTDPLAMLNIRLGQTVGTVWIDDIKLQTGTRPDVWRRDFDAGISLVNPTDGAVTVHLGGAFLKIDGTQDRVVNDGATVTQVTIPSRDGIILLRTPTAVLTASRTLVSYGLETTLQVTIAPVPVGDVRIEKRRAGTTTWTRAATVRTDSTGVARIACSPSVTTEYRAVVADSGLTSGALKVSSRPVVKIRPAFASAHTRSQVIIGGTVAPSGHVHISVQRFASGHWRTVRRLVSGTGRYSTRVTMPIRGTFSYRVYVAADASHLAAVSGVAKVTFR
jgi:hypothetical protein